MDKIRKAIVIFFKVVLILALVLLFNLFMMPKYIDKNQDGRIIAEFYREKLPIDVLFLGSSTVHSGVSPVVMYEDYGFTSYVCATSSQTAWNSLCILKEALKYQKPELVVMDIGFLTVEEDYAEEVSSRKLFDYMRPGIVRHTGIKDSMSEVESIWSYYLPVLRYHERYKDITLEDLKYLLYKPDVTYNGFLMNTTIVNDMPSYLSMAAVEDTHINSRNAECLNEIIDICKSNGIEIMLVKTPSYSAKWGYSFENDINDIAKREGITYINFDMYSQQMGIDWNVDTPDAGGHLNVFGADKYSYFLAYYISETYRLPDRRTDGAYNAVWNSKQQRYYDDLQKLVKH